MSLSLAGRFFTTEPPGKPCCCLFFSFPFAKPLERKLKLLERKTCCPFTLKCFCKHFLATGTSIYLTTVHLIQCASYQICHLSWAFFFLLAMLGLCCRTLVSLIASLVAAAQDMWDLSSSTRNWTLVPCIGRQILNHWLTREVPWKSWSPKNWCFWTVVLEKTRESLGLQGDPTSPS